LVRKLYLYFQSRRSDLDLDDGGIIYLCIEHCSKVFAVAVTNVEIAEGNERSEGIKAWSLSVI